MKKQSSWSLPVVVKSNWLVNFDEEVTFEEAKDRFIAEDYEDVLDQDDYDWRLQE